MTFDRQRHPSLFRLPYRVTTAATVAAAAEVTAVLNGAAVAVEEVVSVEMGVTRSHSGKKISH